MLQNEMPIPAKIRKNKSSTFSTDLAAAAASKSEQPQKSAPSWLTISMDAALGFRANVFQVTRVLGMKSYENINELTKYVFSVLIAFKEKQIVKNVVSFTSYRLLFTLMCRIKVHIF